MKAWAFPRESGKESSIFVKAALFLCPSIVLPQAKWRLNANALMVPSAVPAGKSAVSAPRLGPCRVRRRRFRPTHWPRPVIFFAVGSNDLTMYTLAIDRGDEHVAHLYDPLHPAVLRLIQFSAEAALHARIPVSICGEMAGDPRYTALLLGLGFRELSMIPANIPRVKQRIREMDLVAANRRAQIIMDQMDSGRIAMLLDDFNALG